MILLRSPEMHIRFLGAHYFLRVFPLTHSLVLLSLFFSPKEQVVQANSVQNHLNLLESQCFLCQDPIKC